MIRMRMRSSMFIAGVLAVTSFISVAAQDSAAIFNSKCATCHGNDGTARTAAGKKIGASDLREKEIVEMTDQEMFESIGRGVKHKKYPHSFLYTGLNEDQVHGLVNYIRRLQQKK